MLTTYIHLLSKYTQPALNFLRGLSNTKIWELASSKDGLGLAQFISKDGAVYECGHLTSSEWQKFCGGYPKVVKSATQSQFRVEQTPRCS